MSLLASARPPVDTTTALYTTPAARRAVLNLNVCNGASTAATVGIALSGAATPGDAEWIEWNLPLAAGDVLERSAIALSAGQSVYVRASSASVNFQAWGIEELA